MDIIEKTNGFVDMNTKDADNTKQKQSLKRINMGTLQDSIWIIEGV